MSRKKKRRSCRSLFPLFRQSQDDVTETGAVAGRPEDCGPSGKPAKVVQSVLLSFPIRVVYSTVCPGRSDPTLNIELSYSIQSNSQDLKLFCSVNE